MLKSRWWEGSPWPRLPSEDRPSGEIQPDEEVVMQESRKGIVSSLPCKGDQADRYYASSNIYDNIPSEMGWACGAYG